MTQVLYRATATATGGREGEAKSDDGRLAVALALPAALGGGNRPGTNPEQLFAAGYAACFENALRHVARSEGKPLSETSVTAVVGIGPRGDGGFGLAVELTVHLPGLIADDAEALIKKADFVCPYSHAVRGNIPVTIALG